MGTQPTLAIIVLANCAVFLGSLVQTTTGMGFAMVAAPLLALISLDLVPGPMLLVNLILSALMLSSDRSNINRRELTILMPMIGIGTVVGGLVLASLSPEHFGLLFGLMIFAAVVASMFVNNIALSATTLTAGGLIAGLMGTTSGIPGPPLAVLYQHEDLQKTRPTLAVVFTFAYIASLAAVTFADKFNLGLALDGLKLLPGLILGYLLAKKYRGLIAPNTGRMLMLSIAAVSSIMLIVNSLFHSTSAAIR